jgi:hypothetical protein
MSILRHFNKHHGWHDGKRTPFGSGGGGWNPIAAITDPISSALGTDGGGGGVLGVLADIDPGPSIGETLASVDPGPAIGSGLAEVDQFVNREIPGGWVLPAALAAAYATGYIDPSLFATEAAAAAGAEAGAGAIATEAGQAAFFNALATGATSAEAVSAGLAAEAALGAGALTAEQVLGSGGFTATPGSGASFVVDPSTALGAGSYVTPDLMGPTYGELGVTGVEGGLAGPTYGELGYTGVNPNVPVVPDAGLMGPNYQELGVTGVPEGGMGPTYGELGYTGLNNAEAIAAADAAAAKSLTAQEALSNANRLKNIAKLLTGSESSKIFGQKMPTANQFSAYQQMAQPVQEQFGGYYQMNQNPFTFANPLAAALKGKDSTGYDVSGTGGTSLKTANLAKLLA